MAKSRQQQRAHPHRPAVAAFRGVAGRSRRGVARRESLLAPTAPSAPVRAPTGRDSCARRGGAATGAGRPPTRTHPTRASAVTEPRQPFGQACACVPAPAVVLDHAHHVPAAGPCFNSRRVAAPTSRATGGLASPRLDAFKSERHHPRNQRLPSPSGRIPVGPPLPLRHV